MRLLLLSLLLCCVCVTHSHGKDEKNVDKKMDEMQQQIDALSRQLMLQQFYAHQRVRTEGNSGLKQIRVTTTGLRNYDAQSHNGRMLASIHDHDNNIRTVGLGEMAVVLNGVEFRTRHNDYRLVMPSRTSSEYHKVEEIPFPEVPPTVKGTVEEQIAEMREYFKAFRDLNSTHRNFKPYFKSVLCYLEGAWTKTGKNIDEGFFSDRHFIDAKTWKELQEKNMFNEASGSKDTGENLASLPTAIRGLINGSIPQFAQWNYRIVCHPTKKFLSPDRLRLVEDLSSRMPFKRNKYKQMYSRGARFQINVDDSDTFKERGVFMNFLDELMEEIPGKDNYQANLKDIENDTPIKNFDLTDKNVGYYHRFYDTGLRDAMGNSRMHRGYGDDYLFAAATTQEHIAGMTLERCTEKSKSSPSVCKEYHQKWSYAIPLEVIYLTPLSKWNPYDIVYHGSHTKSKHIIHKDKRNGQCTDDGSKALNGVTTAKYYITPSEFFEASFVERDPADTAELFLCVLDKNGVSRKVRSSGTRIMLPNIPEIGVIRQRYPVMPVHGEGSSVWKELNAVRDMVMFPDKTSFFNWKYLAERETDKVFLTAASRSKGIRKHQHKIILSKSEMVQLLGGVNLIKTSEEAMGHKHTFSIHWTPINRLVMLECDGKKVAGTGCWDQHWRVFQEL